MADPKQQVHLNGAYYGPPIPPHNTHRSVGRSSSSCCCLPCCLLNTLFKLIVSIVFTVGVILLVIWLLFRPNRIQVHVESASLTQFNLTSANNALNYNLSLDISIRNPNKRVSFYYDSVEARAIYDGARFGFCNLPAFYQGHKNTTMLYPKFEGLGVGLNGLDVGTFTREKGEGNFYIEVKIYARIRMKVRFVKVGHFKPKFDCVVKLPVPSGNKLGGVGSFERTKCDVDLF